MYFLLKMGIFQPAMSVYQRVSDEIDDLPVEREELNAQGGRVGRAPERLGRWFSW